MTLHFKIMSSKNGIRYIAYLPPDGSSPIVRYGKSGRKLSKAQTQKWVERWNKKIEDDKKKAEEAKKEEEPPEKEEEK